jgi:hypothetical protein
VLALLGPQVSEPVEPTLQVDLLDNGFEPVAARAPGEERERIPWWSATAEAAVVTVDGKVWLATPGTSTLRQPVAAFAPLADGLVVRGRVLGQGVIVLHEGAGGALRREVTDVAFELLGAELAAELGRPLSPRFVLELASAPGGDARWRELEVLVPLPCPGEAELRAEIVEHLENVFATWLERSRDDVGPRPTTYPCHFFDAVTGERLATTSAGLRPIYEAMLEANALAPHPEWEAALRACRASGTACWTCLRMPCRSRSRVTSAS